MLVEGPAEGGDSGLARALAWRDVALSFDDTAEPPSEPSVDRPFEEQSAEAIPGVSLLVDEVRLTGLGRASVALGGLALIGPWLLCAVALIAAALRIISSDLGLGMAALSVVLFFLFAAGWLAMYVRFRLAFVRRAVEVLGHPQNAGVQRKVDVGTGVISGKPVLVVKMQTRCATGSLGRCRIELYSGGLQIWKGPERPEPRWQFAYGDASGDCQAVDGIPLRRRLGQLRRRPEPERAAAHQQAPPAGSADLRRHARFVIGRQASSIGSALACRG